MATMKAVRMYEYGGPEVLKYENAPRPEPSSNDFLVRVHAAAVNPIDWKIRQGRLKDWLKFSLPVTLGYDLSGVVESAGPGVSKFKVGDEVYAYLDFPRIGAYAQYALATESEAALKPASLEHAQAAAVPLVALVVWQAFFDIAKLSPGQTVLIHGASGGIGHLAVQAAKWKGARVIGTSSLDNLDFVRNLGADEVIDYRVTRFEDVVSGVDVVLDTVGGETQERSWQVMKDGGVLVSVAGVASPDAAARNGVRAVAMITHPDARQLAEIASLIDAGTLKPAVQAVLPLSSASKAHQLSEEGKVYGKIVLRVA